MTKVGNLAKLLTLQSATISEIVDCQELRDSWLCESASLVKNWVVARKKPCRRSCRGGGGGALLTCLSGLTV